MTEQAKYSKSRKIHFCISGSSPAPLNYDDLKKDNVCDDCWGIYIFNETDLENVPDSRRDLRSYHCPARYRCLNCEYPCSGIVSKCVNCNN